MSGAVTIADAGECWLITPRLVSLREVASIPGVEGRTHLQILKTPLCAYRLDSRVEVSNRDEHPEFKMMSAQGRKIWEGVKPWPVEVTAATTPWAWQALATGWLIDSMGAHRGGVMLAMQLGTGKSAVVLYFAEAKLFSRVLVVAPLSVLPAWRTQAELHYPGKWDVITLSTKRVSEKTARARLQQVQGHDHALTVINYDSVWREPFASYIKKEGNYDLIVADESHALKSPKSKRGKFFRSLAGVVPYRLALTGTPLSGGAFSDAWGQFGYLDPGMWGRTWIGPFMDRYSIRHPVFKHVVEWLHEDEFFDRFWKLAYYVSRDQLDLPPVMEEERTFKLPADAKRKYSEMYADLITQVQEGTVVAANAAVKAGKLRQIVSGIVLDEDRQPLTVHTERRKVLHELLQEIGQQPVVVFYVYKTDAVQIHAAAEAAGLDSRELSGSRRELEEWQSGDGELLAVQLQAGSQGIDLTRACYGVFWIPDWSLQTMEQAKGRLHRPGQDRSTTFINLIAESTIDRVVLRALQAKQDVAQALIAHLREGN